EEDVAHGPRGEGEEVRAVGRGDAGAVDEAEVGLVDEPGGVEGDAGGLGTQAGAGEGPELVVEPPEEDVGGPPVPRPRLVQQGGGVGGRRRHGLAACKATSYS